MAPSCDLFSCLSDRSFCLLLFALSFLLYWNTLSGGATYVWDDRAAILSNRDVSGVDPLVNIFYHDFWGQDIKLADSHKSYRPITVLTFRFNHWLHGYNAMGFHVLNILIYALGVVVYFNWVRQWSSRGVSRFAALFYCCHPVHVEAVASLVGRADSLCGLFYLTAIYLYTHAARRQSPSTSPLSPSSPSLISSTSSSLSESKQSKQSDGSEQSECSVDSSILSRVPTILCFAASFLSAVCACFSKEIGITIFLIFICLEVIEVLSVTGKKLLVQNKSEALSEGKLIETKRGKDSFRVKCVELVRLLFNISVDYLSVIRVIGSISLLLCLLLHRVKMNNGTLYRWTILENHISILPGFQERALSYGQSHFWYIFKLIYPKHLSFDYGYSCLPLVHTLYDLRNILPIVTYSSFTSLSLYSLLTMRFNILVSLLLILLPLLPALNIFFPVGTILAERLLFLPSAGYCLILAEVIIEDLNILMLPLTPLVASISIIDWVASFFTNNMKSTVISSESSIDQMKYRNNENMTEKDNKKKKIKSFDSNENKIKSMNSNNSVKAAHKQQLETTNKHEKTSEKKFEKSEKSEVKKPSISSFFESLLSYGPSVFSIYVCVLFALRVVTRNLDWNSEIRLYKSALGVCPLSVKALTNYGTLALADGHVAEAIMVGEIATSVLHGMKAAHVNLGLAYQRQGEFLKSVGSFETTLKMFPDDSKTHGCLGSVLLQWAYVQPDPSLSLALKQRAAAHMDAALNLGYMAPSVLHSRGSLAIDAKEYELALRLLLRALEVNEENKLFPLATDQLNESNTLNQLGNVYLHLDRLEDAVAVFERGIEMSPYNMALRANIGGLYRSLQRGDLARRAMEGGMALCEWGEDGVQYRLLTGRGTQGGESGGGDVTSEGVVGGGIGGTGGGVGRSVGGGKGDVPVTLKPPPAALLNNLGLVELEEGNYQVALFLFQMAAGIEDQTGEGGEMKSADGESVVKIMRNNIRRAEEGLANSRP